MKIEMYYLTHCPYCKKAKSLLESKGVSNIEIIDVEADPENWVASKQRSGRDTVPQIFIDGFHVGGCDDLHAFNANGKLDELLGISI